LRAFRNTHARFVMHPFCFGLFFVFHCSLNCGRYCGQGLDGARIQPIRFRKKRAITFVRINQNPLYLLNKFTRARAFAIKPKHQRQFFEQMASNSAADDTMSTIPSQHELDSAFTGFGKAMVDGGMNVFKKVTLGRTENCKSETQIMWKKDYTTVCNWVRKCLCTCVFNGVYM
jgi:hypothetical protein